MTFIVVRARSDVKVERSIRETMGHMNLTRVNHAVIIPDNPQYRGMLQKAKDYITWGEADAGMVERMLTERGRMVGNAPLTDAIVAEHTDYKNISDFAKAITAGEAQVKDIPELKRVFRLHPLEDRRAGAASSAASLLVEPSAPVAMPLATLSTE